jgi:antitoxin component YwqK of YwqJK toxin-antitoxin module
MRRINYYMCGQISRKCFVVNGKRHGEYISYHENGQISRKCFYVNGIWHGEYIFYHRDGSIDWHRLYVNDEILIDLLESPVCDEEKMLLALEHGVEWL